MKEKKISKKTKKRCEMIHKVGLEMFLENGYEKTSLTDIVKITGGSLSTIYEHFGNKEGFFEDLILKSMENFSITLQSKLMDTTCKNLEDFLYKLGDIYMQMYLSEKSILITRMVYSQGYKDNGKLSKALFEKYKTITGKIFDEYFEKFDAKNILKYHNYNTLREEFCMLIIEPEFTNAVLNIEKISLTKEQREQKAKRVVDIFLNGYLKKETK